MNIYVIINNFTIYFLIDKILIMILKFFKTSLSQVHRNTILRGSLYLFSNDN
jgi:hypothetical protein